MRKISLLIALCLLASVGSVYAAWVYSQSDDVADITNARAINMTAATFEGNYGTFTTDSSSLTLLVDPKPGTTHTTSLQLTGEIVIRFTPATYAPAEVKENGVAATFQFGVSNPNWKYGIDDVLTIDTTVYDIDWTLQADGTFTHTITADELAGYITLTEIELDTKADYDAYDAVLTQGQITLTISERKATTPVN